MARRRTVYSNEEKGISRRSFIRGACYAVGGYLLVLGSSRSQRIAQEYIFTTYPKKKRQIAHYLGQLERIEQVKEKKRKPNPSQGKKFTMDRELIEEYNLLGKMEEISEVREYNNTTRNIENKFNPTGLALILMGTLFRSK